MHGIDGEPLFIDIVTNAVYSTRALFNLYKLTFVYLYYILMNAVWFAVNNISYRKSISRISRPIL